MKNQSFCLQQMGVSPADNHFFFPCEHLTVGEVLDWIESSSASTLVVDFSQVKTIHNNLLVALMKAYNQAQTLGKTLVLRSISPEFKIVLEISQLDRLFPLLAA